jgi:small subunit ribosomal protein S29
MRSLPTLTPEDANKKNVNQVMAFSRRDLDAFDKFGVEKKVKNALSSHVRPSSLVRSATLDLYSQLAGSASASSSKKLALTGPLSGGKSHLMLQAVSYALASDWLVLYIPQLVSFINSTSAFEYSAEEQAYLQPEAVQKFFSAVLSVNQEVLKKMKIDAGKKSSQINFDRDTSISPSATLDQLLKLATSSKVTPLASQRIFDLFLTSISRQSAVPTLLAVDHLQSLYLPSRYRTADYATVQSYELAPVRSLIQLIAGEGLQSGAILAAVSHSNPSFAVPNEVKAVFNHQEQKKKQANESSTSSKLRSQLDETALHAYTDIHPLHVEHVRACNWSLVDVPDAWTEPELRALYELRRKEGRNWNGGNSIAEQAMSSSPFGSVAGSGITAATATEDELFLLRLLDSGRNPEKFEKSVWGSSVL